MTTDQKFFQNIVHSNAITYEALEKIVGNMNKNIGISAKFYEYAAQVLGSTVTENYDLRSSIFFESFFLFNKSRFYLESYEVLDFLETAVCGRTILLFGIFY